MGHTAKIRSKGLDGTGVTEDVAKAMYAHMGGATLAIVELEHVERHDKSNGDHMVHLTIGTCEPILTDRMESAVRDLQRALWRDRKRSEGDSLDGTIPGPSAEDAASEVGALIDRDQEGDPEGVWDGDADSPAAGDKPSHPEPEFSDAEITHTFLPGTTDPSKCAVDGCGKGARAKIHKAL